ncbi:YrdB family protein [Arthrobacter sp.]|uniref:YrdB family protein n=1 Tax=Arthrobacter sp. TaxID=1667 RepID=UPI003A94074B
MQDKQQDAVGAPAQESVDASTPVRASGVLAFVLEVALLCAAALWAIQVLPWAPALSLIVLLVPLLVFWGLFMAPQAKHRFPWPVFPVVAHVLYLLGVVVFYASGHPWFGGIMLVLTVASAATTWLKRAQLAADAERGRTVRQRPAGRRAAR